MGNVWTHTEPILAEVKEARLAYKAQNYAKSGKHFGQTLFKLTGGVVPTENVSTNDMNSSIVIPPHPPIPHPDISVPPVVLEASELVAGLFYGLTGKQGLTDLQQCFYDGDQFVADITIAIEDLVSLTGAGLMNGFILGLSALAYIPHDLKDCIHAKAEAKEFEQWATLFVHPKEAEATISHNIKSHLPALTIDIAKVKMEMSKKAYLQAGVTLGEMLAIVTEPITAEHMDFE